MIDLIRRDDVLKAARADGAYDYVSTSEILKFPIVDAVEVVKCKDCKYWGDEDGISEKDGIRFAWCNIHNHCMHGEYIGWCPKEDDFCSYGERREE